MKHTSSLFHRKIVFYSYSITVDIIDPPRYVIELKWNINAGWFQIPSSPMWSHSLSEQICILFFCKPVKFRHINLKNSMQDGCTVAQKQNDESCKESLLLLHCFKTHLRDETRIQTPKSTTKNIHRCTISLNIIICEQLIFLIILFYFLIYRTRSNVQVYL